VNERLIVAAAQPAGVKAARKTHFQVVTRFGLDLFEFLGSGGIKGAAATNPVQV